MTRKGEGIEEENAGGIEEAVGEKEDEKADEAEAANDDEDGGAKDEDTDDDDEEADDDEDEKGEAETVFRAVRRFSSVKPNTLNLSSRAFHCESSPLPLCAPAPPPDRDSAA